MTIYIPVLLICWTALDCRFYQSTQYTTDEQACLQEIDEQIAKAQEQQVKMYAICVDFKLPKGTAI